MPANPDPKGPSGATAIPHRRGQEAHPTTLASIIAATMAIALIALWAALLPLAGEPASKQAAATSPTICRALSVCRGQNRLDQTCVGALAKTLALEAKADASTQVSTRRCQADQQVLDARGAAASPSG